MFEDSLIDSNRRIKTRSRYFTIVGVLLNSSVLASMVPVPLIYPEALPQNSNGDLTSRPVAAANRASSTAEDRGKGEARVGTHRKIHCGTQQNPATCQDHRVRST